MRDALIGQKLGQYEIRMLLGKGGMSTVYLAYQPSMDRTVAIKVLPREFLHDDTFLTRFQTEVRTIAALEHLHILPVYDVGEEDGIPYYVMRYLTGGTLADLLEGRLLEMPRVVQIVRQVADALDYAHQRGIIHRDLKPSNILLDSSGNAYLADFGIARIQQVASDLTGSRVVGTPPYVAPEMARRGEPVTYSVDIYALGCITYQMLTGEPPFFDPDPVRTLMLHVLEPVPSVRDFDPNISVAVDSVLKRCLAKRPQDRQQTAGEFAREFALAAESDRPTLHTAPLPATPPPAPSAAPDEPDTQPRQQPLPRYEAYLPQDEPEPRRGLYGCLIALGVVAALIGGVVLTAFALTRGDPLSLFSTLLDLPPTRTPQPTVTPTFAPGQTPGVSPPGSPDAAGGGGRLAFASNRDGDYEIYLIDADGSNLRQLTTNAAFDFDPAWSPDGAQIIFASSVDGDPEIMLMNADGSDLRRLTDNTARDADPAWSPDGEWIAFSSDRDGDFDLYLMRPDGSEVRQVTFNDDLDDLTPTWSPDSAQLAYYVKANDDPATSELYLIDIASGTPTRLTRNDVLDQWPDWSPDGARLVFTSALGLPDGRRALFEYNLQNGQITQLTSGLGHDDDPVWSPDGARIAFDSDRGGSGLFNLYSLDYASGSLLRLTDVQANDVAPAWQPQP